MCRERFQIWQGEVLVDVVVFVVVAADSIVSVKLSLFGSRQVVVGSGKLQGGDSR